jgi:uncharacterized protein (TIGR03437 family)
MFSVWPLVAGPSIVLPLAFEQNAGQTDPQVKFLTRGPGGTVWFTEQGPVLGVAEKSRLTVMRMRFEGGRRSPGMEGVNQTRGISNYFIGNDPAKWRTDVPQFEQVRYRDVYPGVDVVFYGKDRNLEYDFVLRPGADPSQIKLSFEGPGALRKDSNGDLVMKIGDVEIRNHKPVIRQGGRIVEGEYKLSGKRSARFSVGAYDRGQALIIDPVMTYGTLLGGSGGDQAAAVAMDPQGNLYLVGTTTSTNFPLKNNFLPNPGTFMSVFLHAFVTKINPSASGAAGLVFSTYFGGNSADQGLALGVDKSGNAVIGGFTSSANLPLVNPINSLYPGGLCTESDGSQLLCSETFVAKFSPTGNALVYAGYLGNSGDHILTSIAMDASGNAWLGGFTTDSAFPIRGNAFQSFSTAPGNDVGFVSEISPAGSLIYSTYFGGEAQQKVNAIAVDAAGNVVIGGITSSFRLPTSPGAFQTTNPASAAFGSITGFVAKLNPNVAGSAGLLYGTYLGGGATDGVNAVAIDSSGNIYAGGSVDSANFPVTINAFRTVGADSYGQFPSGEGFVTKLNPAATGNSQVLYSTLFGGSGDDEVFGIAVDPAGRVVVTGITNSPDLFTTPGAFQCCFSGYLSPVISQFGFLARLDPSKSGAASLLYSTYLGGTVYTYLASVALDSTGNNAVVGGWVDSIDTPVTQSALQSKYGGDGTPLLNQTTFSDFVDLGDAYIASFNFTTAGPTINLYENGGGLSAIPSAKIAPGLVFTVKGTFLGPATPSTAALDPNTGRLATVLEGMQILVDGIACPLVYVSSTQINAIAPYELAADSNPFASVQVVYNGVPGNLFSVQVAATAPGILSFDDGTGQGAIVNQDQTINGAQNPAARGTVVTIYATGEGQTNPPGIDGGLATNLNALPHPVASLSVSIGGMPATNIAYAGTAPEEVYGLLQINVTVPAGVVPGAAVPVLLTIGGVTSQAGLTMAVK